MAQDPKETWRMLQQRLAQAQKGGGSPKGLFGGIGALVLLGGGTILATNSIFNGKAVPHLSNMEHHL